LGHGVSDGDDLVNGVAIVCINLHQFSVLGQIGDSLGNRLTGGQLKVGLCISVASTTASCNSSGGLRTTTNRSNIIHSVVSGGSVLILETIAAQSGGHIGGLGLGGKGGDRSVGHSGD